MASRVSFVNIYANQVTKKLKHVQKQKVTKKINPKLEEGKIFGKIKSGRSYKQLHSLVEHHKDNLQQKHVDLLTEKVTGVYNANRIKLSQAQEILKNAVLGFAGEKNNNKDFQIALINYLKILLEQNQQKKSNSAIIDLFWSISQLELLQDLQPQNAEKISQLLNQDNFRKNLTFEQKCKLFNSYLFWKFGGEKIQQEDKNFQGFFLNGPLFEDCQKSWIQSVSRSQLISNLQQEVFEICKKVVKNLENLELEKISDDGFWSIDIACEFENLKIAIEVEGRDHLSSVNLLKRRNFLRYQALKYSGWKVIVVPFTNWNRQIVEGQKMEYIQNLLIEAGVASENLNIVQKAEQST